MVGWKDEWMDGWTDRWMDLSPVETSCLDYNKLFVIQKVLGRSNRTSSWCFDERDAPLERRSPLTGSPALRPAARRSGIAEFYCLQQNKKKQSETLIALSENTRNRAEIRLPYDRKPTTEFRASSLSLL